MNALVHPPASRRNPVARLHPSTVRTLSEMGLGPAQQHRASHDDLGRSERRPVRGNQIDEIDVFRIVKEAIYRAGSQTAFAAMGGFSKQKLNNQLHARGADQFSDDVLRAARIERKEITTVIYRFIEGAE